MSLLIDLNINKVDAIHANFLRRAKYSKLARAPDNELALIGNRCRKSSSCHMNDIVDSQLIELEWRMEVWFIGHRRVTQAHLLTLIGPESKELALRGECESVTITTTDLSHNIFEILHTSWLFDHCLTTEHPVS